MVGDPELNSFFKNNPMQSSGLQENSPLKVVATHKTIIEDRPFGNRPLGTWGTVPKFAVYQGKRIETTIQPTAANALQEGHTFGGRGYAIGLGVASEVPDPHIADIRTRRSPHNKNPRR